MIQSSSQRHYWSKNPAIWLVDRHTRLYQPKKSVLFNYLFLNSGEISDQRILQSDWLKSMSVHAHTLQKPQFQRFLGCLSPCKKNQNVPLFNSRDNTALRALSINQLSIPGQNLTILPDMWPTPLVVNHKNSHLKSSKAQ